MQQGITGIAYIGLRCGNHSPPLKALPGTSNVLPALVIPSVYRMRYFVGAVTPCSGAAVVQATSIVEEEKSAPEIEPPLDTFAVEKPAVHVACANGTVKTERQLKAKHDFLNKFMTRIPPIEYYSSVLIM